MTPVLEEVLEKVKQLTPEEQEKVREAIDKNARQINGGERTNWLQATPEEIEKERQRRLALSAQIKGKYKHLSSVDEFIRRKQEDIEMEDKGWQPPK